MRIDPRISTLIILSSLALAACAPQATPTPQPTQTPRVVTVVITSTPEPTATPTSTPQPTATPTPPCEPSGVAWITRFPTSQSTDDLTPVFREEVNRFIAALKAANASVKISETYRSPERAYLMHYAYVIARENFSPVQVPPTEGVNICWLHRDAEGNPDLPASKKAAGQMATAFNIAFEPTTDSLHIERRAIDMTITWQGDLKIVDGTGKSVVIKSEPRNGNNAELHKVGATYGLAKLVSDPPHWFDDGGSITSRRAGEKGVGAAPNRRPYPPAPQAWGRGSCFEEGGRAKPALPLRTLFSPPSILGVGKIPRRVRPEY